MINAHYAYWYGVASVANTFVSDHDTYLVKRNLGMFELFVAAIQYKMWMKQQFTSPGAQLLVAQKWLLKFIRLSKNRSTI